MGWLEAVGVVIGGCWGGYWRLLGWLVGCEAVGEMVVK